jgi:hypothetical protein
MKLRIGIATAVAFLLMAFGLTEYLKTSGQTQFRQGAPEILNWDRLDMLDYRTGNAPDWLKDLSGQVVRVPGFIVPLEDDYESVAEFLLVPDPGSCVHVPPPPPNQMVYVRMKSGNRVQLRGVPVWVTGKLKIENIKSPYGSVAYSIEGDETEPFKGWDQF